MNQGDKVWYQDGPHQKWRPARVEKIIEGQRCGGVEVPLAVEVIVLGNGTAIGVPESAPSVGGLGRVAGRRTMAMAEMIPARPKRIRQMRRVRRGRI